MFSINLVVNFSSLYFTNLAIRVLWETLWKFLLNSSETASATLTSSTRLVIASQKAIRMVRHGLPLVNLCWLIRVAALPSVCLEMLENLLCNFCRTEVWLTGLWFPRLFFLPVWKAGVTLAFWDIRNVPWLQGISEDYRDQLCRDISQLPQDLSSQTHSQTLDSQKGSTDSLKLFSTSLSQMHQIVLAADIEI